MAKGQGLNPFPVGPRELLWAYSGWVVGQSCSQQESGIARLDLFYKASYRYPHAWPHPFQLQNLQQKIRSGVQEAR